MLHHGQVCPSFMIWVTTWVTAQYEMWGQHMFTTCLPHADNETLFRTINILKVVILTKKIQDLFTRYNKNAYAVRIIWQNKLDL